MALTEEPELVKTPSENAEGVFTLKYKNRFLYSKYNPQKNVGAAVQALDILPGSLVLAFSPCLFYAWPELSKKCEATGSEILCVESDPQLHALAQKQIHDQKLAATLLPLDQNNPRGLDDYFCRARKKCRRVVRLDMSAGTALDANFYKNFFACAQNIVAAFWKNRLTLVRLGRLYCKNILKNLPLAASAFPFDFLEHSVEKPILVCGAGESLEELTSIVCEKSVNGKNAARAINDTFFVLAVDAALPALTTAGIGIDAAAATESQLAIEKAYIGLDAPIKSAAKKRPFFFFDLSSRSSLARRIIKKSNYNQDQKKAAASFYFSEFDKDAFIGRLQNEGLLPQIFPPLGSVGLTAVHLALRLRKNDSVPVCVMGLDFSFSAGKTHARGTAQSKALLAQSNRLRPAQNIAAAFGPGSQKIIGKNGAALWTSKNLLGYAALFRDYFKGAKNLYDIGQSGIDLGLEKKRLSDFLTKRAASNDFWPSSLAAASNDSSLAKAAVFSAAERVQKVRQFLRKELEDLRALADLLSNGEAAKSRDKSIALDKQILAALDGREYLYLHFPDGTEAKADKAFLTRVRAQIDFFAKDIETALTPRLRPT